MSAHRRERREPGVFRDRQAIIQRDVDGSIRRTGVGKVILITL